MIILSQGRFNRNQNNNNSNNSNKNKLRQNLFYTFKVITVTFLYVDVLVLVLVIFLSERTEETHHICIVICFINSNSGICRLIKLKENALLGLFPYFKAYLKKMTFRLVVWLFACLSCFCCILNQPRRESHLPKSIHTPIFAPTSRIRTTKTDGTSVSPKLLTSVTVVSPPASTTKQETALESVESPPSPKSPAREIDHPHILHLSPIYTQNQISDAIDLSNHELASHPEQIVTVNLPTNDSLEHTLSQHRPHLELMHINHKGKKTRKPKRPKEDSQMRMHHLCHYNPRKPIKEHK